jgi:hypothetical protein
MKEWRAATFNARSEEVDTKASFKTVWKRNRCLMSRTLGDDPTLIAPIELAAT